MCGSTEKARQSAFDGSERRKVVTLDGTHLTSAIHPLASKDTRADLPLVCRATLVCDSTEEARRLAFDGSERRKVVTLDGTQFAKSGYVTGGYSQGMEANAKKFDEGLHAKQVKELKQVRTCHQFEQLQVCCSDAALLHQYTVAVPVDLD